MTAALAQAEKEIDYQAAKHAEREAKTYPPHDCREVLTTHFHNQDDAAYDTCGVCGCITRFDWREQRRDDELARLREMYEDSVRISGERLERGDRWMDIANSRALELDDLKAQVRVLREALASLSWLAAAHPHLWTPQAQAAIATPPAPAEDK